MHNRKQRRHTGARGRCSSRCGLRPLKKTITAHYVCGGKPLRAVPLPCGVSRRQEPPTRGKKKGGGEPSWGTRGRDQWAASGASDRQEEQPPQGATWRGAGGHALSGGNLTMDEVMSFMPPRLVKEVQALVSGRAIDLATRSLVHP